ncbi:MAG TPA: glycosyltransferase [Solirubrobacteraceae bacterium]|nr:glycosyltransferase [Solirubrobacteraceae bacterium]
MLILSADVGEGHAAAARALREQLERSGAAVAVEVIDGLEAMGPLVRRVVSDGYRKQLKVAPRSYSAYYWLLGHAPPVRALTKLMLTRLGARSLARAVAERAPDVVVSTYPAITVVLSYMRRRRMLAVPAVATITDMTGLFFWAQRGIDTHLVMYEASLPDVERIAGRGSAEVVRPLIAAEFLEPRDPSAARAALGLPRSGHVVVVSGGGWGVGDLDGAVAELTRIPDATIVCVAGRNEEARERLAQRFAGDAHVRILGFTDRMADLLAAADVLVHSTGGVTCLEAMARGCPIVSYGLPVGHAKLNTRLMADHELLRLASTTGELVEHVEAARRGDAGAGPPPSSTPDAAEVVLRAPVRVRPIARWRLRLVSVLTSLALVLAAGVWVMSTDELDAIAAMLGKPVKTVQTGGTDAVALVVHTSRRDILPVARWLKHDGAEATFATTTVLRPAVQRALRQLGDGAVPALSRGSFLHWIHTTAELRTEARGLHLSRHFYYLEPLHPSFGELILARAAGAQGVAGAVQLDSGAPVPSRSLGSGDVVVLRLARPAGSLRTLERFVSALRGAGLSALPLPSRAS